MPGAMCFRKKNRNSIKKGLFRQSRWTSKYAIFDRLINNAMVPIVLLLFAVLLVVGLTDILDYDQLDNFKNNYYDQGQEFKTISAELELPSSVPAGAIKFVKRNVLRV